MSSLAGVLVVTVKEIVDNMRDRQTMLYALLFGPVMLPLLLGGSLVASFKQLSIDFDRVTELPVAGAERAPNLIAFLRGRNIDAIAAPEDIEAAVRGGEVAVVLEIGAGFSESLRAGRPAAVTLYLDEGDKASLKEGRRIEAVLDVWKRTIDGLRMQHRGIDPAVFDSLDILTEDVSRDGATGQLLASLLPFLFIVSMVMGGFYLAIDTTAGERERASLEPLLGLPLARRDIVLGKYLATLCFVTLSGVLCATSVWLLFRVFPLELGGTQLRFDGPTIARAFLLATPLLPFVSALLIAVSAWTRSMKEAQTYLGLLMVVPMAPFFVLQFVNAGSSALVMPWPMLSQYILLERSVLGGTLRPLDVALSVAGTLGGAAVLLAIASALYRRERLLS